MLIKTYQIYEKSLYRDHVVILHKIKTNKSSLGPGVKHLNSLVARGPQQLVCFRLVEADDSHGEDAKEQGLVRKRDVGQVGRDFDNMWLHGRDVYDFGQRIYTINVNLPKTEDVNWIGQHVLDASVRKVG